MKGALFALLIVGSTTGMAAQVPYGIDARRQPHGTNLDSLLPSVIGQFRRAPLARRTPVPVSETMSVKYGAGADTVALTFRIPGTPGDAGRAVTEARDDAQHKKLDMKGASYSTGHDPSWFQTTRWMAWSRGGYFFLVQAAEQDALDRFMKAFPY